MVRVIVRVMWEEEQKTLRRLKKYKEKAEKDMKKIVTPFAA